MKSTNVWPSKFLFFTILFSVLVHGLGFFLLKVKAVEAHPAEKALEVNLCYLNGLELIELPEYSQSENGFFDSNLELKPEVKKELGSLDSPVLKPPTSSSSKDAVEMDFPARAHEKLETLERSRADNQGRSLIDAVDGNQQSKISDK